MVDVIDLCSDDEEEAQEVSIERTTGQVTMELQEEAEEEICRHFWRAGDYDFQSFNKNPVEGGMDHVRVHPKFLHSNATSHKWALGAIAELLDNSIDEVENGATFVKIDKITNPRDNSPALLILDNGGGMSPESLRHCMSLGYSSKSVNAIGQYGNGFKTSTMRLGADVIVFTRCMDKQSVGLLSYTFLRKTGQGDIVVPMLDFEKSKVSNTYNRRLVRSNPTDWLNNMTTILRWSPFSTEDELLKQFEDIGDNGTKIIVYNLWLNDDGFYELDFDSSDQDIQLRGGGKGQRDKLQTQLAQEHISHLLRYSLRAYSSVLYLQLPPGFQIILRGKPVEHHSIAADLKFPEYIAYKPQIGGNVPVKETTVITTIGFTKEAPLVNVHGFNVYHKNRLIMPFWKVFHDNSSRGRGVVGVLEANFIEPAHDKQDFEKTALLLRLETRLKQMTLEYWNLRCEMIGYQTPAKRKALAAAAAAAAIKKALPSPASIEKPRRLTAPPASTAPTTPPRQRKPEQPQRQQEQEHEQQQQQEQQQEDEEEEEEYGYEQTPDAAPTQQTQTSTQQTPAAASTQLSHKRKSVSEQNQHNSNQQQENNQHHHNKRQRHDEFSQLEAENSKLVQENTDLRSRNEELETKLRETEVDLLETKNKYIQLLLGASTTPTKLSQDDNPLALIVKPEPCT